MQYRELTAVDLFAGLGGFRIAGQDYCDFVWSCDIDPDAQTTYQTNFSDTPQGDITRIQAADIPAHDVLCSGFPCPSFSLSGKREGFHDPRGRLFFEVVRIAEYHQPAVLFLENVKNLVFHDGGKTMAVIVNTLEQAGYRVFCKVLNASHFGAPTSRERVYFVCVRKDIGITNFEFPLPRRDDVILADVLDSDVGDRYDIERDDIVVEFTPPPHERYSRPIQIGKIGNGGQGYRIYSPQGHAVTFAAQTGGAAGKTGLI